MDFNQDTGGFCINELKSGPYFESGQNHIFINSIILGNLGISNGSKASFCEDLLRF